MGNIPKMKELYIGASRGITHENNNKLHRTKQTYISMYPQLGQSILPTNTHDETQHWFYENELEKRTSPLYLLVLIFLLPVLHIKFENIKRRERQIN